MTQPRRVSLRLQLLKASLLTTAIVLCASAVALLLYELSVVRGAWVAELQTQAELLARSTAAALQQGDRAAAQDALSVLRLQSRIRAATVLDANGAPFASYAHADEPTPPLQADAALLASGHRFDGSTLLTARPIARAGQRIGTLVLQAHHDVPERARNHALLLLLTVLAGLGLALAVFSRLLAKASTPLNRITDIARQVMAERDWSLRAPATHYQDIAVLVDAFNGVLGECQKRTGELEHAVQVRQQAERELRLEHRRKDEFLATLAHELRNPLAPMTSALALVRLDHAPDATRRRALTIIDRQLHQMVRLIDDLLDVSRLATGKLALQREPIDVLLPLRNAVDAVEATCQQRGLTVAAALPDAPVPVDGDAARLTQVFSNLLNNACRYTAAGGRVEIAVQPGADAVEIAVVDTGIGIDPSMHGRVFELFEQADKSLERGNAGLGIGLTLARQLVRLHGGDITLDSAGLGQGARFTVRLPRLPPTQAWPAAAPAAAAPAAAQRPLRILIADDNVDFSTSMAQLLQADGHSVEVVADGDAALEAIAAQHHDVGLLDVGMPGTNGYDVARRIRADARTRRILLVAITGWGQTADRDRAQRAGFDRHLVKPVQHDALKQLLRSAFDADAPDGRPAA